MTFSTFYNVFKITDKLSQEYTLRRFILYEKSVVWFCLEVPPTIEENTRSSSPTSKSLFVYSVIKVSPFSTYSQAFSSIIR